MSDCRREEILTRERILRQLGIPRELLNEYTGKIAQGELILRRRNAHTKSK